MSRHRYIQDAGTPEEPHAVITALARAVTQQTGVSPSVPLLSLLAGQSAFEAGHWRAESFRLWCAGNERCGTGYTGHFTHRGCNERIRGELVWFCPPDWCAWPGQAAWLKQRAPEDRVEVSEAQTKFRAFLSLQDGCDSWIAFLRKRYRPALEVAATGNVDNYAAELQRIGYFTATLSHYQRILRSTTARYQNATRAVISELAWRPVEPVSVPPTVADVESRRAVADSAVRTFEPDPDWDAMRSERDRLVRS